MANTTSYSLSAYELRALEELHSWKNPPETWMTRAKLKASESWNAVTDMVHKIPGVDWAMENVISGVLELTNEITQDSVWTEAVIKDFHSKGHEISHLSDVHELDLEEVDLVLSGLDKKYIGLASVEGVATGAAGAAGIVPDRIALVSINLRAAGEYASYCGFDITHDLERLYALELLDKVAQPSTNQKDVTLSPAVRTASRVARQQGSQLMEQVGVGNAIEAIAKRLGMNLTEKKLAQMVPVTGALLGGGLNYLYTTKVCNTAHFLYRERFLVAKYGEDVTSR